MVRMLNLAYKPSARCSALASQLEASERHVRRVIVIVAAEYLRLQLLLLGALVARARENRPVFFAKGGARVQIDRRCRPTCEQRYRYLLSLLNHGSPDVQAHHASPPP